MNHQRNIWLDGIMGVVVGDALGVPVEFIDREQLEAEPVMNMIGYGTYHLPKGSWSDDSSMTLATLDSLKQGYDLLDIMDKFVDWMKKGAYTPFGKMFDIGNGTYQAITRFIDYRNVKTCGGFTEYDNGNGSLMRIMPICLYLYEKHKKISLANDDAIQIIHDVSGLTHNHRRSKIACGLYYFIVKAILEQTCSLKERVQFGLKEGFDYYESDIRNLTELSHFERIRNLDEFQNTGKHDIRSSGYVIDTMEAAIWCLITSNSYSECTLKAVNLGQDTDTVAAIAGGLAGLYYGYEMIPQQWLTVIQRKQWIEDLCQF